MISCVVVFDGNVLFMKAHTRGCLYLSCVKFSQTGFVVLKNLFRN